MATKFKVWVDSPSAGTNVQSMSDFSSDSQRQNGFAAGNAASAIRVNTALREATLITTAIMDTIAPNSNVDVTSTVAQVKSAIASHKIAIGHLDEYVTLTCNECKQNYKKNTFKSRK